MTSTDAAADTRETVYAAIELSKKTWVLGIAPPDRDRPSIHRIGGGNIAELVSRLRVACRNNRRIVVCYEAGYDGFWLARALVKIGIECRVLDPASIQVNRRARRVKTDRIDVLALLRALIATDRGERHVCAVVRVPQSRKKMLAAPIANVSVLSASAPATSIGSRDCCLPKASVTSSRSCAGPGSILPLSRPRKVMRCQIGCVANSNANTLASP
jgi:hypothetical protein